jgi:hypothetical protein
VRKAKPFNFNLVGWAFGQTWFGSVVCPVEGVFTFFEDTVLVAVSAGAIVSVAVDSKTGMVLIGVSVEGFVGNASGVALADSEVMVAFPVESGRYEQAKLRKTKIDITRAFLL